MSDNKNDLIKEREYNAVLYERLGLLIDKYKRKEIAKGINCDTSLVTKHYKKSRNVTLECLYKYAQFFNVSVDYLLGLTNAPNVIKDTDDENMRIACDYTGLNKKTIEILNNSKGSTISEFIQSCILSTYKNFTKIWNEF